MLSLRRRLVLGHLAAIVAIVACAALAGWWQLSQSLRDQLDAALLALAETEAGMAAEGGAAPVRIHETLPGAAAPSLVRLDRLVQIVDADGRVLARSGNLGSGALPVSRELLDRVAAGRTAFETLPHASDEPLRMVTVPAHAGGRRLAIQVAGSLDDVDRTLRTAAVLLGATGLALLVAVGWAGMVLTRGVLRAIDGMVGQARLIGEANLHERLPHPGTDDEIGRLADTLNAMLDRLEATFAAQRRFSADASHELRSPLSRLRTEIDVTLRRPRTAPDYVATLRSCMDEVRRLTSLVEDLLMLARLDAGAEITLAEPVALMALAQDALSRLRPAASARGIGIVLVATLPPDTLVARAPASLALDNLLDNALKFSPPGARVTVTLAPAGDDVTMSVQDGGPGIAPADLPHVFERIYRGADARAYTAGVGLGLALSRAVVQAYGGAIDAANAPQGGALFTVRLPRLG